MRDMESIVEAGRKLPEPLRSISRAAYRFIRRASIAPPRHWDKKRETVDSIRKFMSGEQAPPYPAKVFLEVSNLCDLKCAMCGPFSALSQTRFSSLGAEHRGFMKKPPPGLLDEYLQHALRIEVFGYGEPTLHPEFLDFIGLAGQYEALIHFFSNGMHITTALADALIDHRVHEVTVSFSGACKTHYEAIYLGGVWETVLNGLRLLTERKRERGSKYPRLTINSLAYQHHVDQFDRFVEVMADVGVQLIYLHPLVPVPTVPALAQHTAIYRDWVEGMVFDRAAKVAAARRVDLNVGSFTRGGATSAEDYQQKRRRLLTTYGLDPDALPPMVPIEHFDQLAKSVQFDKSVRERIQHVSPFQTPSLPASALGAAGTFCFEPFSTMYIGRNFSVKPCCNAASTVAFPKLGPQSAQEIWNGEAFSRTRSEILSGNYPAFCHACVRAGNAYADHSFVRTIAEYSVWFYEAFAREFGYISDLEGLGGNLDIVRRWESARVNSKAS